MYQHSATHILENLVYELHLGTKTLTGYCSHHASFNGICYPPPLNIDGVEPEHSKSVLIGIRDVISNSVKFTFLRWEMFYWRVAFIKLFQ